MTSITINEIRNRFNTRYAELNADNKKTQETQDKPAKKPKFVVKKFYKKQKQFLSSIFSAENNINFDDNQNEADPIVELEYVGSKKEVGCCQTQRYSNIIINVSFGINVLLLLVKIAAAVMSNSLSIISSVIDSSVDIVSSLVSFVTSRKMKKINIYKSPQGRRRLEPIGVLIISCIMAATSFQIITESLKRIITKTDLVPSLSYVSLAIIASTVVIKFTLFMLCLRPTCEMVKALRQDHLNDTISNIVAIAGYLISNKWEYADALFAMLISIYIFISWWMIGNNNIKLLAGRSASPEMIQKITWLSLNHDEEIREIDTVRAYSFGPRFLVEVDIVLPHDMPLLTAHNIGESLQQKLEKLDDVERAFVHVDYNSSHSPTMEHKIGILE